MSSVKTDVNPSDIGTKAVVQWRRVTLRVTGYGYGGLDESNDRHM